MVFEFQRLTVGFYHSDFSLVFSIELTLTLNIRGIVKQINAIAY